MIRSAPNASKRPSILAVACASLFALLTLPLLSHGADAQELVTFTKKASFDDARFDLTNAITNRGLVIDSNGKVGDMLARTGKDVGSTKAVYKAAEYFAFCSAKLSREMMEADAANLGYCPFIMFAYETAAKPGEVVVGYRKLPIVGNEGSSKAFGEINAMLDAIAKEAAK
jgi:uncharacterized protein (DUF302 family)